MYVFKMVILLLLALIRDTDMGLVQLSAVVAHEDHKINAIQRVQSERLESVVLVEGDVIMGNVLPRYAVVCEETYVHGNPQGDYPLYRIQTGSQVRLREMYGPYNEPAWVMIKPAEWLPMSALCAYRGD